MAALGTRRTSLLHLLLHETVSPAPAKRTTANFIPRARDPKPAANVGGIFAKMPAVSIANE